MYKKNIVVLIIMVLLLLFTGCNTNQTTDENSMTIEETDDMMLSSNDYTFEKAIIHRQLDSAYEIDLISWEFVGNDMIHIVGKKSGGTRSITAKGTYELIDKYFIPYEFLVSKENVTFYTISEKVSEEE